MASAARLPDRKSTRGRSSGGSTRLNRVHHQTLPTVNSIGAPPITTDAVQTSRQPKSPCIPPRLRKAAASPLNVSDNVYPAPARKKEVCLRFLTGRCPGGDRCNRIHPRNVEDHKTFQTTSASPPIFVIKLPPKETHVGKYASHESEHPSPASPANLMYQAPSTAETDSTSKPLILEDARSTKNIMYHNLPDRVPSSTLQYDGSRSGTTPPYTELDSGETLEINSPDSSSQTGLSVSLVLDDSTAPKAPSLTGLPPSMSYLCRHWLMKRCRRGHACTFVHGDLEYDPPAKNVTYPPSQGTTPCRELMQGTCSRGYLCPLFHHDLPYCKPVDFPLAGANPPTTISLVPPESPLEEETNVIIDTSTERTNEKKYPPPRSSHFCRKWLLNRCARGVECDYFHGDIEYDPPVKGIHPPPPNRSTCKDRECHLGYACRFVHEDLVYDLPLKKSKSVKNIVDKDPEPRGLIGPIETVAKQIPFAHNRIPDTPADKRLVPTRVSYNAAKVHATGVEITPVDEGLNDPPVGMRPPPKYSETCVPWLRGICRARYKCYYRHDDLEYDSLNDRHVVTKLQPPSNPVPDRNLPREPQAWMVKVHDHARVKLGAGFEIQGLETGFETPWIYLGNIPSHVTTEDIATLLHPFGEVVDVKFPARINSNMLVRARFSTSEAAREANTSLNGIQMFGCKLSARLPIHSISHQDTLLQDTSVRIKWEVPSMVAYCGYPTMEQANEAIAVASCTPFRDRYLHGTIYAGLPAVGVITVRFRGVPLHTTKEAMAWLAKPDDIVWARPNYKNLDNATKNIKAILEQDTELTSFVVLPPPYKSGGLVQAWAHFNTCTVEQTPNGPLNGRKPVFTGRTRINAQHIQSLSLSVEPAKFDKIRSDIDALSRTAQRSLGADISVVLRPPPLSIIIKVSGNDLKAVGQLKLELEKILNWEIVRHGPNFAWDPFFAHPAGISFLQAIEREIPGVSIRADDTRRTISLLGCSKLRTRVRQHILDKVEELRAQTIHIIFLESWLMGIFIKGDLKKLQAQLGWDNVNLDLRKRQLAIRGGEVQYQFARDAVARACQAHRPPAPRRNIVECPVCFDEVTNPVTLPCGHAWCRECLSRYLKSSVDNKYFPLTCLGSNAKCTEHIPLQIARRLLTVSEFDAIVDAAFAAHVQSHTDEFHYCPTPDCRQIYRPAPRDTVLQCPSCLLRICPSCHVEAHDGFACPDPEADNKLFREWMRSNDVKPCPGCKIPIERAEGCNHMTCTQCKTHSCWVCLQTFPKGDGIYDHMRAKHGGIGLADD